MKLRLQEDPKEWRKNALLTAVGVGVISSLLRWRKMIPSTVWLVVFGLVAATALLAVAAPRLFRGYYRFSHRLGFHLATAGGYVVLGAFFVVVMTPMGLILRAFGQDSLKLKRRQEESYWRPAPKKSSLDSLF